MSSPDSVQAFGPLAAVLEAEKRRGNKASLTVGMNLVRGMPPDALMDHQLDRRAIEEEFDLGPFLEWWPMRPHQWSLVDVVSRARLTSGTPSPFARFGRLRTRTGPRRRIGYLEDYEQLRTAEWQPVQTWGRTREPAEVVARRVREVTEALPAALGAAGAAALPGWFRAACAPDEPDWGSFFRHLRQLPAQEQHHARWASRWSVREWLRCLTPDQATWRDLVLEPVAEHLLEISGQQRGLGAPRASARWLLDAAGVAECGPEEVLRRA